MQHLSESLKYTSIEIVLKLIQTSEILLKLLWLASTASFEMLEIGRQAVSAKWTPIASSHIGQSKATFTNERHEYD